MDMEDLLCPQVCMDVDDTPIDLGTSNGDQKKDDGGSDSDESEIPLDVRINILMEQNEFLDPAQIPEELTEEEVEKKNKLFSMGPAVEFMKLHCTSCNNHLGSAPVEQFNRYIHPLLHVLQCKDCYDFYCSGDFDKDEDGSELYCRWCGQGGKVMCCSECCHVFCQKCVRTNLGKKALDAIKSSDDWVCFICNPEQLTNLKIVCYSLFHHVQSEIKRARELNDPSILKADHTMCCNRAPKPVAPPTKRKRSTSEEDKPFIPYSENDYMEAKKKKVNNNPSVLQKVLTSFRAPDNPPVFTPRIPWNPQGLRPNTFLKVRPIGPRPSIPIAPKVAVRNPILLCTSTNQPISNVIPARAIAGRAVSMANPSFRIISSNQQAPLVPINSNNNRPLVSGLASKVRPGSKHTWFDHAARSANSIVTTLSKKLLMYENDQVNATSIEQLAVIHNKLQELLSGSVNSLIGVRKNLRNEFLAEINKFKVVRSVPAAETSQPPPLVKLSAPKPPKDDDVIIINNEEDPLAIKENEVPEDIEEQPVDRPRTFIKVKPVSSLIDRSRLSDYERKLNGVTEQIDLCDEDDEVVEVKEATPPENVEAVKEVEAPVTEEAASSSEMDSETYRQIQCALAESKFESLVQENSKIPTNESISARELRRMLSVRVILAPNYKRKQTVVEKPPQVIVEQDFEEMLSGSIVLNTSKQNLNSTEVKESSEAESDAETSTNEMETNSPENANVPESSEPGTVVENDVSTERNDLQASSNEDDATKEAVNSEETAKKQSTEDAAAEIIEPEKENSTNIETAEAAQKSLKNGTNIETATGTESAEESIHNETNIENASCIEATREPLDDDTNIEKPAATESNDGNVEPMETGSESNPFLQDDIGDSLSKAPSEPSRFDHSSTDTIATTDSGIELDPKLP